MQQIIAGKPATGEHFVGRQSELQQIIQLTEQGQSVVLIAPRRFGKTSLLLKVIEHFKRNGYYISYVDLFSAPTLEILAYQITHAVLKNKRLEGIFHNLRNNAVAMLKNIHLKAVIENFEYLIGFASQKPDPWNLISESVDFIDGFSQKNNRKMVVGLDEFGDINRLDGDAIVKLFRSKIQLQKNATYIFCGSYESVMHSLFTSKSAPFYRFARIITLGFIDCNEFKGYLRKQLKRAGVSADKAYVDRLLDITKGHPYYTRLFLQQILLHQTLEQKLPGLDELTREVLTIEKNYLEKVWEEICARKENMLVLLAVIQTPNEVYTSLKSQNINVFRALKSLTGKGLLFKGLNRKYEVTDPLLERWIREAVLKI
ncbi:MAG: ATP-binding protein [Bacteroidales bacterium]|nr:ATP-binding protein [Lentimicrobiaceae bacterium]MDD5693841.1 ATP-binding protein [Bacteroidales bacterium]